MHEIRCTEARSGGGSPPHEKYSIYHKEEEKAVFLERKRDNFSDHPVYVMWCVIM